MSKEYNISDALHYMKILQKNCVFMQPEIRKAIDFSVRCLELSIWITELYY